MPVFTKIIFHNFNDKNIFLYKNKIIILNSMKYFFNSNPTK